MKIKDLIEELQKLNPETLLVMSSDSEGNAYSPVSVPISVGHYFPDSSYSGDFYEGTLEELVADGDYDSVEEAQEDMQHAIPAVCIWPVN